MAKVQAYISDEVSEKIFAIVEKRRAEGAKEKDVSFSGVVSMLIELGVRVYEAQMERKESGFNQMQFNKLLLESVIKTQFSVNKVIGISSQSPRIAGIPKWEWPSMVENFREGPNDDILISMKTILIVRRNIHVLRM